MFQRCVQTTLESWDQLNSFNSEIRNEHGPSRYEHKAMYSKLGTPLNHWNTEIHPCPVMFGVPIFETQPNSRDPITF